MSNPEPMAYIARAPCGCIKLATVDSPERKKDNAKQIALCIAAGYTVERVSCAYVREHWLGACDHCRRVTMIQGVMEL